MLGGFLIAVVAFTPSGDTFLTGTAPAAVREFAGTQNIRKGMERDEVEQILSEKPDFVLRLGYFNGRSHVHYKRHKLWVDYYGDVVDHTSYGEIEEVVTHEEARSKGGSK